jgi:hypothetical protein
MTRKINRKRSGQTLIEFSLAVIPLIFLLISLEEVARGMWIYVTLAHAMKEGSRYAVVHGADCVQASSDCQTTVGDVAALVKSSAVGLDPGQMNVQMQSAGGVKSCSPLSSCIGNSAAWPPSPDNSIGRPITISATYPFNTMMSMFVPHWGSVQFNSMLFGAASQEEVVY